MTDHADVILRFPLPLPANAHFSELGKDALDHIVACNFHPGDEVKIRPKDCALHGEMDAENALAQRTALAGQALKISSTTVEILSNGYYRARHGIEGLDILIDQAALVDAVAPSTGCGAMFRHQGRNWLCLFDRDDTESLPTEQIGFTMEPVPVDDYCRQSRNYLGIDQVGLEAFEESIASNPISGRFSVRREADKVTLAGVDFISGLGENERTAVERRLPGFVASDIALPQSEVPEMTL